MYSPFIKVSNLVKVICANWKDIGVLPFSVSKIAMRVVMVI